jgi:hypothetical protein
MGLMPRDLAISGDETSNASITRMSGTRDAYSFIKSHACMRRSRLKLVVLSSLGLKPIDIASICHTTLRDVRVLLAEAKSKIKVKKAEHS